VQGYTDNHEGPHWTVPGCIPAQRLAKDLCRPHYRPYSDNVHYSPDITTDWVLNFIVMRLRVKWCLSTNGYMLSHSASPFSWYLILYALTALFCSPLQISSCTHRTFLNYSPVWLCQENKYIVLTMNVTYLALHFKRLGANEEREKDE
jgi:hypothetical protein